MKKRISQFILILLIICLMVVSLWKTYSYAESNFILIATAKPEENNNHGAVELNWSSYSNVNTIFKGYQSKNGGTNNDWTSISLMDYTKVKEVKALQVYPDATNQGHLKQWMESNKDNDDSEVYGKNIIKVTEVSMTEFNTHPDTYLYKRDGKWNYDVIFFGTSDRNNCRDLSLTSKNVVDKFIGDGYGCIFGHDTILNNSFFVKDTHECTGDQAKQGQNYFDELAKKYFTSLELGSTKEHQLNVGGTEVKIIKNGLFTTYPWQIGNKGTVLVVPYCHSWGQRVKTGFEGNIWLRFNDKGDGGDNFYLITQNNVSMIQTGHSGGAATPDEQKIIANLIFSSYQISTNTSTMDRSAMDEAKPTAPTINVAENDGNINITFSSEDVGTTYTYKVEAYDKANTDIVKATSTMPSATVTTGLDKFYYVIDEQQRNDFAIETGTEATIGSTISTTYEQVGKKYIHMKAKDKAGNLSDVKTVKIKDEIPPEITVEPRNTPWAKKAQTHVEFTDKGGSKYRGYQYAIDNNSEGTSASYSEEVANASDDISITEEGTKYLHIKGFDNDGNNKEEAFGPYLVDITAPTVQVQADLQTQTTLPIDVTIKSEDPLSGVKEVRINGEKIEGTTNATTQFDKNGTYKLEVEDIAGNIYTKDIVVENIYQKCTAGLEHPDFPTDIDHCPICDLIEGLKATNETEVYNAKEKHVSYENPNEASIVEYYNGKKEPPVEVGSYPYNLKVEYNGEEYETGVQGTFLVTQKEITIEGITAQDRQYDGTTIVKLSGGTLVGVEESDIDLVGFILPETGTIEEKNIGTYYVMIPEIQLNGLKAKNYSITQPAEDEVSVKISKRKVTIDYVKGKDRKYNKTNIVDIISGKLLNVIEGEDVNAIIPEKGVAESEHVGSWKVEIDDITLAGADIGNYELIPPDPDEITVNILKPYQPKLHIESYISKINDEEVNETIPVPNVQEDLETNSVKVKYEKAKLQEKLRYADKFQITIRIYNEGKGAGYAEKITNIIPEGVEFLKNDETNIENEWKQIDDSTFETEILSYEKGEENEIKEITQTANSETEETEETKETEEQLKTEEETEKTKETEEEQNKQPEKEVDYKEVSIELFVKDKGLVEEEVENITSLKTVDIEGKDATEDDPEIETNEPTIAIAISEQGWKNANKHIIVQAIDGADKGIAGYAITTENEEPTEWEEATGEEWLSTQTYDNGTYYAWVKDKEGNISESKEVVVNKIDKVKPEVTNFTKNIFDLNGTAYDNESGINAYQFTTKEEIDEESDNWESIDNPQAGEIVENEIVTEAGTYYFYVKDQVGNINKSTTSLTVTQEEIDARTEKILKLKFNYYDNITKQQKAEENQQLDSPNLTQPTEDDTKPDGNLIEEEAVLPIKISYSDLSVNEKITCITKISDVQERNDATNNGKLEKIEVNRKKYDTTNIKIDYDIEITNNGNETGNIDNLIINIPEGTKLSGESASIWQEETNKVQYTKEAKVKEGETKTIKLSIEGKASEIAGEQKSETMLISSEDANQRIIENENNQKIDATNVKENMINTNNYSEATAIISISTWLIDYSNYLIIALIILIIIGIIIIFINKKRQLDNGKN